MTISTQDISNLMQRLRCGALVESSALAMDSVPAAQSSPNSKLLSLQATHEEISRFESSLVPVAHRLTVIPSPAEVMYAVFSVQSAALAWRHVVPLWDEDARRWLEDCIAHQRISMACNIEEKNQVTVMQWLGAWPQSESLLRLAESWPELADQDKLVDLVFMLNAIAAPSAIQSAHAAYAVEDVQVVVHCNWLLEYLQRTPRAGFDFAVDAAAYSAALH